jgi:hypothetical protein
MAADYSELLRYYQDFLGKFYGGTPLITPQQEAYFSEQERWMQRASGQMESRAMENLAARGVTRAGIGTDYLGKYVYEPLAQAEAQLGSQRAGMIAEEQARRQQQALAMAMQKQQEERERGSGLLGTIGKIAGTVVGGVGGFFAGGPAGAMAGAGLLGGLGGSLGGGGGGGADYNQIMQLLQYLEQTQGQGNVYGYLGSYGAGLGGGGSAYFQNPYGGG